MPCSECSVPISPNGFRTRVTTRTAFTPNPTNGARPITAQRCSRVRLKTSAKSSDVITSVRTIRTPLQVSITSNVRPWNSSRSPDRKTGDRITSRTS